MRYATKEVLARTALPIIRGYRTVFGHYPYVIFPHQEPPDPLETALSIMHRYFREFGSYPNIFFPKTFNDKVQVRKIFDRRPFSTLWADKYAVRQYVADILGPEVLPTLLYETFRPDDIPFDRLPKQYVVTANHASSWIRIVKDGDALDRSELVAQCKTWLSRNYFDESKEWQYRNIRPRILVKAFLDGGDGNPPCDYRIFVFDGSAKFIQIDLDTYTHPTRAFYDTHWNRMECLRGDTDPARDLPRPDKLDLMIDYAQRLSNNIDFIRVDLYEVRGKVYFGELTFNPGGGVVKFVPPSWDRVFGDFWKLCTE